MHFQVLNCIFAQIFFGKMELKVIAYARNGHTDKFGIPRQSRDESPIYTRIVFEPEYRVHEALRGIEGYSHLWLLWGFSENDLTTTKSGRNTDKSTIDWSPTVRPPRLGGNTRMGVFATRSPFRPNPIGLSSVRLVSVEDNDLIISGADVMDGTPIYDIKPYLSFTDSHPEAQNGFAEETRDYRLNVEFDDSIKPAQNQHETSTKPRSHFLDDIAYILSQDPRPAYQDDPDRAYKMDYAGYRVTFTVKDQTVHVRNIEKV